MLIDAKTSDFSSMPSVAFARDAFSKRTLNTSSAKASACATLEMGQWRYPLLASNGLNSA